MPERPVELDRLQRWMQTVVMHPDGAVRGVAARTARELMAQECSGPVAIVRPSRELTALDRLDIYASMYYWRLLGILREEYPCTRHLLGERDFERAGRSFITRHPSKSRSLNHFSESWPEFLGRHLRGDPRRGFAVDLARVERAMEDVFDERQVEPLSYETLAAVPAAVWAAAVVELNPALRLLRLGHPVNGYMNALRGAGRPRRPPPRASWLVVYRHQYRVRRVELSRAQYRLLGALTAGEPLGRAVALALTTATRRGESEPDLASWFQHWTSQAFFCSVRSDAA